MFQKPVSIASSALSARICALAASQLGRAKTSGVPRSIAELSTTVDWICSSPTWGSLALASPTVDDPAVKASCTPPDPPLPPLPLPGAVTSPLVQPPARSATMMASDRDLIGTIIRGLRRVTDRDQAAPTNVTPNTPPPSHTKP